MHLLFDTALMAPVRGWLTRAERLLGVQGETPVDAWLAVVRNYERMLTGDVRGAREWARRAIDIGARCDPAAAAIGRVAEARSLILDGEVQQGLALLDEAGVATASGELDPLSTGVVYCELVCALQGLAQYDLAEEWTEAMERWRQTNAIGSLHGRCRVHRAEILRLRGSCDEAEKEALLACEELRPYLRRELGWPLSELGRIRLRKGDIDGAEEALLAAHHAGWDPQPGLALVRLAQGDVASAAASIRDALENPMQVPSKELPPNTELRRAPLLEAQVEIEVAAGDLERARAAADELEAVAGRFESKALAASAALAYGRVRLAEGATADARTALRRGGASLARGRRTVRGGGRPDGAGRGAPRPRQCPPGGLGAAGSPRRLRTDQRRTPRRPSRARRRPFPSATGTVLRASTSFAARATTGQSRSTGTRCGCGTSRACATSPGSSPTPGVSSTCSTSSPPKAAQRRPWDAPPNPGCRTPGLGDAGPLLDARAKEAYRRRLAEIEDDIGEARAMGDGERAAQADVERDLLIRELSRAVGLGGRDRRAASASERARASVTRADPSGDRPNP